MLMKPACRRGSDDGVPVCVVHEQGIDDCLAERREALERALQALGSLAKHARHEWEHHRPVQESSLEIAEAILKDLEG